jgi:hypothetical protein
MADLLPRRIGHLDPDSTGPSVRQRAAVAAEGVRWRLEHDPAPALEDRRDSRSGNDHSTPAGAWKKQCAQAAAACRRVSVWGFRVCEGAVCCALRTRQLQEGTFRQGPAAAVRILVLAAK